MPNQAPHTYYSHRLSVHQAAHTSVTQKIRSVSRVRLLTVLGALAMVVLAINQGNRWQWIVAGLLAAAFLVFVRLHQRFQQEQQLLQIRMDLLAGEEEALAGKYQRFPKGDEYIDSAHPYTFDLDIFGAGSIYQMLCRTTTLNGAKALAALLMDPPMEEAVIYDRQKMVQELSAAPLFLEDFRTAGTAAPEEKGDDGLVRGWLNAPEHFINNPLAKIAIAVMPLLTLGLIIYTAATGALQGGGVLAVMINWIVLGIFGKKIKMANAQVGHTARLVEKYQRLQSVAATASFMHPELAAISTAAKSAAGQITRFRKLANMFDSRNNSLAGPLMNSLLLFDIYCLLQLEGWRRAHKALLLQTMDAMIKLDVLVSCATYAFNHPENSYPTFQSGGIEARNLRHPLLAKSAVGNDCSLGRHEKIYLLTGANMTGKSTFIRSIGTVTVLSYTGISVPADALSLPVMRVFTAIRITDSVQNDVSYFRAELNRIKAIMDTVQSAQNQYLVLLDEPLRGTNSGDKQQGTRSIIESLLRQNVIGIVATHDIGLCILQDEHPGKISNYHFESTLTPDGLAFDFKLHPGGSTSNNATILMRQMGIIQ